MHRKGIMSAPVSILWKRLGKSQWTAVAPRDSQVTSRLLWALGTKVKSNYYIPLVIQVLPKEYSSPNIPTPKFSTSSMFPTNSCSQQWRLLNSIAHFMELKWAIKAKEFLRATYSIRTVSRDSTIKMEYRSFFALLVALCFRGDFVPSIIFMIWFHLLYCRRPIPKLQLSIRSSASSTGLWHGRNHLSDSMCAK